MKDESLETIRSYSWYDEEKSLMNSNYDKRIMIRVYNKYTIKYSSDMSKVSV